MRTTTISGFWGTILSLCVVGCGGADPIHGADGHGQTQESVLACPATPSPGLFTNALCLCSGFSDVGELVIANAAQNGMASAGIDGASRIVNATRIDGTFSAWGGLQAVGDLEVGRDVITPADLEVVGRVQIGGNLAVGGKLDRVGQLDVAGSIMSFAASGGPPCDCTAPLDIAARVEAAKQSNMNAAHNLPTELSSVGAGELALSSGTYYFDELTSVGRTSLRIQGTVALHLQELDAVGEETFALDPGATLDLYVAGAVRTVGSVRFGDSATPSAFRLYVGGKDSVALSVGDQQFRGMIYAPQAAIAYVGDTRVEGGLFADRLSGVGRLEIAGAAPQATSPAACGTPAMNPSSNPSSNPPSNPTSSGPGSGPAAGPGPGGV
jgi:hypothetical protein